MARVRRRWAAMLIAAACASTLSLTYNSMMSAASTSTYKAGKVRFQADFPSMVTSMNATYLFSGMPGLTSATVFSAGTAANDISSGTWKPNAFAVEVITYKSTLAAKTYFQEFGSGGPFKKKAIDGRSAYTIVGSAAVSFLDGGTPPREKNVTGGLDWVLDGTSIFEAWSVTTAASKTTSFLDSLKILS